MIKHIVPKLQHIAPLFEGWGETLIWSCLQGHMGCAAINHNGRSARIDIADFCFFAGTPDPALVLQASGIILTPRNDAWADCIRQTLGDRVTAHTRYSFYKDASSFDREMLTRFALPAGYELRRMDTALAAQLLTEDWSRDFCSAFDSPEDFATRGIGYAALWDGVPVAGASSYSVYTGGIEIEVDTLPTHRRKGLATACCAALILDCLDRGLYPSWDAANLTSVMLAQKLGYRLAEPYTVYILK